jgi:hypothetical protein
VPFAASLGFGQRPLARIVNPEQVESTAMPTAGSPQDPPK